MGYIARGVMLVALLSTIICSGLWLVTGSRAIAGTSVLLVPFGMVPVADRILQRRGHELPDEKNDL
ncbi:hypothetical protein SAMN05216548_11644 [Faunimonas pinastri]|uniref:Uncharacterized protein n=1 Tax=Faunimonas pinastri TaxID=1855383 RepID=A0A1H9NJP7_9HYPH|nr:hypothetical protein [Faunimonas pinastri]SER36166.1 hypothetical protein SAMN05216548_11644 [Faunimonas pinastri]